MLEGLLAPGATNMRKNAKFNKRVNISQGSVTTCLLQYDGIFNNHFTASFL